MRMDEKASYSMQPTHCNPIFCIPDAPMPVEGTGTYYISWVGSFSVALARKYSERFPIINRCD